MSIAIRTLATTLLMGSAAAYAAGHAHVHGVAKLDIAVEANSLTVLLESPLDNLLGFERAPRTDAERRQADAAITKLRSAAAMFGIDPAAQCKPAHVELSSSALKLGHPDPKEQQEGHADIDGSFEFKCADASKAAYIDVGLFDFARLQRLEVQVATPHGQFRRDLKRPARRIVLTK
ncbi:DUF2796 domain-containing protein [Piscinibacter sp.]|jgi:hypothetical protein|uniref:DUF2796 domain-containing protein n=1 Tax=Piscinibacter sp. TaxID=1903157 RepID=UPI00355A2A79